MEWKNTNLDGARAHLLMEAVIPVKVVKVQMKAHKVNQLKICDVMINVKM